MGLKNSILVIDDDPQIVQLLLDLLEGWGYRASAAPDAMQAVIQAEAIRPKLIISDIQMPTFGTGVEALAEMRKIPHLQEVPVVFVSGMKREEAFKLMPDDPSVRLLSKPIQAQQLKTTIEELLGA